MNKVNKPSFYCQKILPLVYDDSLSYYETLCKLAETVDELSKPQLVKYANPLQWDITSNYTKNTVVVDPKTGDAYMSIAPVPTGTDIKDTQYWLPIFNYTQQLNALEQRTNEKIGTLEQRTNEKIGTLEKRTNDNHNDINTEIVERESENIRIDGEIEANRKKIDDINAYIDNQADTMVVIGDSYSTTSAIEGGTTIWSNIVAQKLRVKEKNYAVSGSGFGAVGVTGSDSFISQARKAVQDESFNNNNVKYVFVYGSLNDLTASQPGAPSNITQMQQLVSNLFAYLFENFKNAIIMYVGCTTTQYGMLYYGGDRNTYNTQDVVEAVKNLTNAVYLKLNWMLFGRDALFGTNGHPNQAGQNYIAKCVISSIYGSMHNGKVRTGDFNATALTEGVTINSKSGTYGIEVTDEGVYYIENSSITFSGKTIERIFFPWGIKGIRPMNELTNETFTITNTGGAVQPFNTATSYGANVTRYLQNANTDISGKAVEFKVRKWIAPL